MSFGLKTPREYIEDIHGRLHDAANAHLKGDVTSVSIVSMNDGEAGQMILADTSYDKRKLAARLRLCADILDPPQRSGWSWWGTVEDTHRMEFGPFTTRDDLIVAMIESARTNPYEDSGRICRAECVSIVGRPDSVVFSATRNKADLDLATEAARLGIAWRT